MYGASRSLLRLIDSIDRDRYEPRVIVPENGPLVEALRRRRVEVTVLSRLPVIRRHVLGTWRIVPFALSVLPFVLYLWWYLRHHRIDLVHTNSGVIFVAGIAARLRRTPHVWHLREVFEDEFGRIWRYYCAVMLRFSDRIVCVSTPIADQFPDRSRVVVIHNGFDLTAFDLDPESVCSERERYLRGEEEAPGDGRLAGVVGRLSPRKGQDVFLQAAATLTAEGYRDVRYLIIGDALPSNEHLVTDLRAFVEASGLADRVRFTGFVPDPRPLIAALDLLVVPSIKPEAFPGVVVEGMALGVPVVATATGGTVEQVDDERSGLLVPPGEPTPLAGAMKRLLDDPELGRRLGAAARARVESRFTVQIMLEEIDRLYRELLGQSADVPVQGALREDAVL